MNKIYFNDKYHFTEAVLEGRKTQLRTIIPINIFNWIDTKCLIDDRNEILSEDKKDYECFESCDGFIDVRNVAKYYIGETVAIAQSYNDIFHSVSDDIRSKIDKIDCRNKGWSNKMFVRANLMPNRIKITNIRVERLQDISFRDCINEGVKECRAYQEEVNRDNVWFDVRGLHEFFNNPFTAFAKSIDGIYGEGTWFDNPLVFVYDFQLVK